MDILDMPREDYSEHRMVEKFYKRNQDVGLCLDINSHAQEAFRQATISSSVASGFTLRMFSATVPENIVLP